MATKISYGTPTGGQVTVTRGELRNDDIDPFKVHLDKLVEKNRPYFNHLGGSFTIDFKLIFAVKETASAANVSADVVNVQRTI